MSTKEIIKEINRLPLRRRMLVLKKVIKLVQDTEAKTLEKAAVALIDEYKSNNELTAFAAIEFDKFYEAR